MNKPMSLLDPNSRSVVPPVPRPGTYNRKQLLRERQEILLKLLPGEYHQEKLIGGFWFVKNRDGNTGKWYVATYTEESYKKYKEYAV